MWTPGSAPELNPPKPFVPGYESGQSDPLSHAHPHFESENNLVSLQTQIIWKRMLSLSAHMAENQRQQAAAAVGW